MENRGYTREKSVSIIASQAPETFFRENADYVVVNNGDFAQTRRQIEEGIRKYETLEHCQRKQRKLYLCGLR